jgi:hypothetical protein
LLRFPFALALLPAAFNGERRLLHLHPIIIAAAVLQRAGPKNNLMLF